MTTPDPLNERRVGSQSYCVLCGFLTTTGHDWSCPLNYEVPAAPKMGAGEIDGQNLIDMNNLAVGFVKRGQS